MIKIKVKYWVSIFVFIFFISLFTTYAIEPDTFESFFDALWWGVVTLTTVGYGDVHPVSTTGKIVAMFLMIGGIGLFSIVVGEFSSKIISAKSKSARGLKSIKKKDRILLCCSDPRTIEEIIQEYKKDKIHKRQKFIIISESDSNPLIGTKYENTPWVKGNSGDPDILEKANIQEAKLVYVFNKEDADTILTVLQIKSLSKETPTIARYYEDTTLRHLKAAGCDHMVNPGNLDIPLLVQVDQNPFVLEWIEDIINRDISSPCVYNIPLPKKYIRKKWDRFIYEYKKETESQPLAFVRDNMLHTNPSSKQTLRLNDRIIVISNKRIR